MRTYEFWTSLNENNGEELYMLIMENRTCIGVLCGECGDAPFTGFTLWDIVDDLYDDPCAYDDDAIWNWEEGYDLADVGEKIAASGNLFAWYEENSVSVSIDPGVKSPAVLHFLRR